MAEKANEKKRKGLFSRIAKSFRELKAEVKKVVWPNKKQVVNSTMVVIACLVIIGAFIWVLDLGLSLILNLVF